MLACGGAELRVADYVGGNRCPEMLMKRQYDYPSFAEERATFIKREAPTAIDEAAVRPLPGIDTGASKEGQQPLEWLKVQSWWSAMRRGHGNPVTTPETRGGFVCLGRLASQLGRAVRLGSELFRGNPPVLSTLG
nr:hypothetical protein Iba_chr09aCG12570 [Ipomoea batatas]